VTSQKIDSNNPPAKEIGHTPKQIYVLRPLGGDSRGV
jgi:hypothetical protein